jgi:hypothetical protein
MTKYPISMYRNTAIYIFLEVLYVQPSSKHRHHAVEDKSKTIHGTY